MKEKRKMTTLHELLYMVAKDKGVSNKKRWVETRIKHGFAFLHDIYLTFCSSNNESFGVLDTSFPAPHFLMYKEDSLLLEDKIEDYHLDGFDEVMNQTFMGHLGYLFDDTDSYETTRDYRLYFDGKRVDLKIYGKVDGVLKELHAGDSCLKNDVVDATFNFYVLLMKSLEIAEEIYPDYDLDLYYNNTGYYALYYWNLEDLEKRLLCDFKEFFTEEAEPYSELALPCFTCADLRVYIEDRVLTPYYVPKPKKSLLKGSEKKVEDFPLIFWKEEKRTLG